MIPRIILTYKTLIVAATKCLENIYKTSLKFIKKYENIEQRNDTLYT